MAQLKKKRVIYLWALILIPYFCLVPAAFWYFKKLNTIKNSSFVLINKETMMLYHFKYDGTLLQKSKIATGKNPGNKMNAGDLKTPEGVFRITNVEDASGWKHDFKDDTLGEIAGAYGPNFIRLDVPKQKGIGIHGTHDDHSIGTRVSEGCIRMHNQELRQLVDNIHSASIVVITPGAEDVSANQTIPVVASKNTTPAIKKKKGSMTAPKKTVSKDKRKIVK